MSKPSNCIPVSEARQLQSNWVNSRAKFIEKEMGAPDACEFLFTVEELQEFLDYVKAGTGKETPGIRVYFAAYGTDNSSKATVFLAPTLGITADAACNYELQPLNKGVSGWPPKKY